MNEPLPQPAIYVSPRFSGQKLVNPTVNDMVDVYEDRVRGFLLDHARAVAARPNSELAVLLILIAYFESHAMYLKGQDSTGNSKKFFSEGFVDVFRPREAAGVDEATITKIAGLLYEDLRCGLAHDALTRDRVLISNRGKRAIQCKVNNDTGEVIQAVINPAKWIVDIDTHLARYVDRLRDTRNADLRERFERLFRMKSLHLGIRAMSLEEMALLFDLTPPQ